uniref:Uncharacterized protein n=1 Tax=Manihot esculenta TaxID=3983 RepID=A0A2C9U7R1_MANES
MVESWDSNISKGANKMPKNFYNFPFIGTVKSLDCLPTVMRFLLLSVLSALSFAKFGSLVP